MLTSESVSIESVGRVLTNPERPLKDRFRALFTLRNLKGEQSVRFISECFSDPSALLKHECAYCLGQMQDSRAVPCLVSVLKDANQDVMVRHEAGEALGALSARDAVPVLQKYASDPCPQIAETCQIALRRIEWCERDEETEKSQLSNNPYLSVDPAPPSVQGDTLQSLEECLLDESLPLFVRYRALFSLRNLGNSEAAVILSKGLNDTSALFRHEIAYVLGQMQQEAVVSALVKNLENLQEDAMVRHECAEALGAIASEQCKPVLQNFLHDKERVVRESCLVALDMYEHEVSEDFQYADTLTRLTNTA